MVLELLANTLGGVAAGAAALHIRWHGFRSPLSAWGFGRRTTSGGIFDSSYTPHVAAAIPLAAAAYLFGTVVWPKKDR
jgi:hypothetical protein